MLLRFYLLKYNDTIIVQSGVFVNTDRHKKSHRKGRFCGSFFGKNHEVYLCKTSSFIVTVAFACGDTKAHWSQRPQNRLPAFLQKIQA